MAKTVLVVGERKDGGLRKTALEALSAGRQVAEKTGAELAAMVVGSGLDAAAAELAAHGAVAYAVDDASYARYSSETYADAIVRLATDKGAAHVLFADTSFGK